MRKVESRSQTRLAFQAKMNGLAIRPAKEQQTPGRFELGLLIEQPVPPKPPTIPWEFADGASRLQWKPRPGADVSQDDGEEPSPESDQVERAQARYDAARGAYDEAIGAYNLSLNEYRIRVRSYAELCGLAAVFGNQFVSVVITPANQDILPGFVAELSDPLTEAPLALLAGRD